MIFNFECVALNAASAIRAQRVHRVCLSFFSQTGGCARTPTGDVNRTFNVRSMTISTSFILLYMHPLFFWGSLCCRNAALCSVFSRWNGWIGSGVVASLITDWPCGIYIIMAGWPRSIQKLYTSHPFTIENKQAALSPKWVCLLWKDTKGFVVQRNCFVGSLQQLGCCCGGGETKVLIGKWGTSPFPPSMHRHVFDCWNVHNYTPATT